MGFTAHLLEWLALVAAIPFSQISALPDFHAAPIPTLYLGVEQKLPEGVRLAFQPTVYGLPNAMAFKLEDFGFISNWQAEKFAYQQVGGPSVAEDLPVQRRERPASAPQLHRSFIPRGHGPPSSGRSRGGFAGHDGMPEEGELLWADHTREDQQLMQARRGSDFGAYGVSTVPKFCSSRAQIGQRHIESGETQLRRARRSVRTPGLGKLLYRLTKRLMHLRAPSR